MSTSTTAYRVYVLKRLAFERSRGEVDPDAFAELCRSVLERHATEGYADPFLRKAAVSAANLAIADVTARARNPAFDLDEALHDAEAELAAERNRPAPAGTADAGTVATAGGRAGAVAGSAPVTRESGTPAALRPAADQGTAAAAPRISTAALSSDPASRSPSAHGPGQAAGRGAMAAGAPRQEAAADARGSSASRPSRRAWLGGAFAGALTGAVAGFAVARYLPAPTDPNLRAIAGEWIWVGGARVRLAANGTFTFNGRAAGHYFATSARHFVLVHDQGRFIDYVTLDDSGQTLTGYSAAGVRISATRARE